MLQELGPGRGGGVTWGKQVPLPGILSSVLLLHLVFRVRQQRLADPFQFEQLTDSFCLQEPKAFVHGGELAAARLKCSFSEPFPSR